MDIISQIRHAEIKVSSGIQPPHGHTTVANVQPEF